MTIVIFEQPSHTRTVAQLTVKIEKTSEAQIKIYYMGS